MTNAQKGIAIAVGFVISSAIIKVIYDEKERKQREEQERIVNESTNRLLTDATEQLRRDAERSFEDFCNTSTQQAMFVANGIV